MARAEAVPRDARLAAPYEGGSDAAWGVAGLMGKSILPDDPKERRRRVRLCALRALDRLGLLDEENLIATLADRPRLRWLADEEGARWTVLAQLGRIGEPAAFEEAVEWALQNRPRPEEAGAYVRRLGSGALRSAGAGELRRRSVEGRTASSSSRVRRATGEDAVR
jgi:hypothetical protein